MTDRVAAYVVTLDHDIREDDAEVILNAIRMIKFVRTVTPVVSDYSMHVAEGRRDDSWREALHQLAMKGPGK